ncbi:MAG: DNA repair protein RadC [Candidatus Limnocylindria bacterium]
MLSFVADDNPRQRLARLGTAGCSIAELVALVLGGLPPHAGTASARLVADRVLESTGGLAGLAAASTEELRGVPGIGVVRAASLVAALELGRRAVAAWPAERWQVRSPADVAVRLVPEMGRLEREELRVVLLNTKNVVVSCGTVYVGNLAGSLVRVGEVFRDAVRRNAAALMVVHNHPSGDPAPSAEDLRITRELSEAGRLLDIGLLDHLIIGQDRWVSLRALGVVGS